MAGKRKDLNRRNLPDGVSQKKDGAYKGRYCYTYMGLDGKRHSVYSYRLYETDPVPKDKKADSCVPLMTTIAQIERDRQDGICSTAGEITFNEMFQRYMKMRPGIKDSTSVHNVHTWDYYVRDRLGSKKISKISYSDIKSLYLYLLWEKPNKQTGEKGLNISTVNCVHVLIGSVFNLAQKDKIIRDNPADGVMADVKAENKDKVNQNSGQIKSLTVKQQRNFLLYIKTNEVYKKWYNLFVVLFGTGMRIGELSALRNVDLDFENNVINVNYSMGYYKAPGSSRCDFHITTPKTSAGKRTIPMFPEVREALLRQLEIQLKNGHNKAVVDGYSGFVFQSMKGHPLKSATLDATLKRIVERYNREEEKRASEKGQKPELLPYFSPHDIRHTFATRMAENGANQLVMKKVMGHKSIETTMDIYAEVTDTEERSCFEELEGNMSLA